MCKILIIWCSFLSLLIRKRGQIWWRCHANSITTCYLMYSRTCTVYLLTLQPPLHWPNQESEALQVFSLPNQKRGFRLFSLLLRVVRLKSDKYQPEHLTSVSHFKRTTVEATFGLRVDYQPNYSYKQQLIIRCIVFTMPKIMYYLHAFRYRQYKRETSRVFFFLQTPPEIILLML